MLVTGNSRTDGFSLLEMLLVVLIIGVLAAAASLAGGVSARERLQQVGDAIASDIEQQCRFAQRQGVMRGLMKMEDDWLLLRYEQGNWLPHGDFQRLALPPASERFSWQTGNADIAENSDPANEFSADVACRGDGLVLPFNLTLSHPDADQSLSLRDNLTQVSTRWLDR